MPPLRYSASDGVTSLFLFGHCHGNGGAHQIYFALIHFLSVSMNMISGFFIILTRGCLCLRTTRGKAVHHSITVQRRCAARARPRSHTHTRGLAWRGDLIHMDTHRSVEAKGQGDKCSLLTSACTHFATCLGPFPIKGKVSRRVEKDGFRPGRFQHIFLPSCRLAAPSPFLSSPSSAT